MASTLRTITVAKLLELLEGEEPDARVIFSANYGDYSRTEQALPLRGELDTVTIEKSAYSNSGFAVAEPDEEDEECKQESERHGTFLVIR